ncbi:uncharacterized protein LOC108678079 isoform X1 [Hyalella azteca]|uniref:Uncharacterized protein LOC108678079 isoform X1 n=1 Tax=Hyalella azteca TaxID=294128 RepID=A0A8B7P784_HYAAZ|nr:uncharacterized protein LOC108678079 isoform X1 [Hyalella azteca]
MVPDDDGLQHIPSTPFRAVEETQRLFRIEGFNRWPKLSDVLHNLIPKPKRESPFGFRLRPTGFRRPQFAHRKPPPTNGYSSVTGQMRPSYPPWPGTMNHNKPGMSNRPNMNYYHLIHESSHGYESGKKPMPGMKTPGTVDYNQAPTGEYSMNIGTQPQSFTVAQGSSLHMRPCKHYFYAKPHVISTNPGESPPTKFVPMKYPSHWHEAYIPPYMTPPNMYSTTFSPEEADQDQIWSGNTGYAQPLDTHDDQFSTHFNVTSVDDEVNNHVWIDRHRRHRWAPLHAASYMAEGRNAKKTGRGPVSFQNVLLIPVLSVGNEVTDDNTGVKFSRRDDLFV